MRTPISLSAAHCGYEWSEPPLEMWSAWAAQDAADEYAREWVPDPESATEPEPTPTAPHTASKTELEIWQLSDTQLAAELAACAAEVSLLQARQARLLVEIERRRPAIGNGMTVAEEIHATHRVSLKTARTQVLQADDLTAHPQILAAVENGECSYDQAVAAVAGLNGLPDWLTGDQHDQAVGYVLDRMGEFDPVYLRRLATRVVGIVAPEATDRADADYLERHEAEAHKNRFLTWHHDSEGSVTFHGRLPVADAEPLIVALRALAQAPCGDDQTPYQRPTRNQRHADALIRLVTLAGQAADLPALGAARPTVHLTITLDSLLDGLGHATLDHTTETISASQARRLACDVHLVPVVLDGDSVPLDVGRTHRLLTPAIRTALTLRDGGCIFPGCDRPPRECDAHHIIPWRNGGETSLHNLALLCPHHHTVVEPTESNPEHRWQVRIAPDGIPETLPPQRIDPNHTPRRHARHRLPQ